MAVADIFPAVIFGGIFVLFLVGIHLQHRNSFRAIARDFNGKARIILGEKSCRFVYKSIPTKVAFVNGGKGYRDKLLLSVHGNPFLFTAHLTRKDWAAPLLKQQLWGPFSRKIQTGMPDLDEKLITYTKYERDVTDYLANTSVRDIITNLADDGWQDMYFTSKGMKIEKPSPSAAHFRSDYLRVTLEKLHSLQRSYDNLYEPNQALQRTDAAEL